VSANRHVVDQLADVRQEIKRLQYEETFLKQQLEQPGADLQGDEFVAYLSRKSSSRLDRKKFEQRHGRAALDGLMSSSEFTTIEIRPRINKPGTTLRQDMEEDTIPF
jgi:hypothetical protein